LTSTGPLSNALDANSKGKGGRGPIEDFARLFGSLLSFVYHCFDRIVILGHLPLLTRPENIVHFFRDVHGVAAITKEVLRQRTIEYNQWVEAFARNHQIPMEWAEKGVRKEDYVRPRLQQMERRQRCGVYFILKSMEVGTNFRVAMPKYPTADPDYRILSRQRSRYTHYYFHIRDPVLGPMALASARSCRSRSPTTSTAIISSNNNCAVQGYNSAKMTTLSSGWLMLKRFRRQPTRSAPSSFAPAWTTGP
jgi:hypothetical protein